MTSQQRELLKQLESVSLEQARLDIATGKYGQIDSPNYSFCSSWLAAREASARDLREASTLALASEANSIARSAKADVAKQARWALYANIIAITALIIAAKDQITSLMGTLFS